MAWIRVSGCILAVLLLAGPSLSAVCPDGCVCVTRDGLHRATCSSLPDLYKFTLRQKHHNINILDLSHNNITKLTHELDRLSEVVTLDLSTNGITDLKKFLQNAKKLVHLNLANNRIHTLSVTHVPASVSSLDLTNNLLQDVPSNIEHLWSLEHLELEGNPIDCSCKNIRARDTLLAANVFIDKVKCETPEKVKGRSWLELKTKDICKLPKVEPNPLYMMMGDQPIDAVQVGEESSALKSMSMVSNSVLEEGHVINGGSIVEEDDSLQFMKVSRLSTPSPLAEIEGSGEIDSTTTSYIIEQIQERKLSTHLMVADEILAADNFHTTDDHYDGSGEGSGFGAILFNEPVLETTTPMLDELNPGPVTKLFEDETLNGSTEFPMPKPITLYQGDPNWHSQTEAPAKEKAATPLPDTTMSQKVTSELANESPVSVKTTTHKTGTYICIAIIVILLIGLIGFAIIKGQMRKRRDRRLLRQQRRDVERASKEMVDMNKSLLGKPAVIDPTVEKKVNGKYELVPTHEPHQKKGDENGEVANGINRNGTNSALRTDSPRDTNQNKSSSKDHNLTDDNIAPVLETSFESADAPDSRKDTHSLSSDDIFVPLNDDDSHKINGNVDFNVSRPLINGNELTDSDFLSPSREYVPVYSPDMGRVRIKMSETPKPKTPVLVTRSRSNAGDIVITPSLDGSVRKSTT